jgi:hypothetical protein
MNIWEELTRKEVNGYTIIISKTWEELRLEDCFEEQDIKEFANKIDNGELDWFTLRVRATKRDYVLGEAYLGGLLYADAMDVLNDPVIEDMIIDAISDAEIEAGYLKELL